MPLALSWRKKMSTLFKATVAMKKYLLIIAAFATLVVSCQKTETNKPDDPDMKTIDLTIHATMDQTKTYITYDSGNKVYNPLWKKNDVIAVSPASKLSAKSSFTNQSNDGEEANFTGTTTITAAGDVLYAYYPKALSDGRSDSKFKFAIPNTQTVPDLTTFNGSYDLLVAKPQNISGDAPTVVNMQFRRVLAVLKVILRDDTTSSYLSGAKVTQVKIESSSSLLTGRVVVDIADDTADITWEAGSSYKYVIGSYAPGYTVNGSNALYLIVNPVTLASTSTLTVDVTTDNSLLTVHKEVTLSSALELKAASVTPLKIALDDACVSYYSEPVINAADVEIDAAAVGGTISYSVDNAVSGGEVSAAVIGTSTISNLALGTPASGSLPFTCDANTESSAKTATVRLTYTFNDPSETVTKDVVITQKSASAAMVFSWDMNEISGISGINATSFSVARTNGSTTFTLSYEGSSSSFKDVSGVKVLQFGGKYSSSNKRIITIPVTSGGELTIVASHNGSGTTGRPLVIDLDGTNVSSVDAGSCSKSSPGSFNVPISKAGTITIYPSGGDLYVFSVSYTI